MSSASYRAEAGSTDAFTTESIISVNDKTEASSTSISSVADTDVDTTTALAAFYISLPVVITAVGFTFLVMCFISRRKELKSEPHVKYNVNPSSNRCQNSGNGTGLESNDMSRKSNTYDVIPNTSQCVEGTARNKKSEDNIGDEYSTIFIDRGNTLESQSYGNFNTKPFCSKSTHKIYSHIHIAQGIPTISPADNTYSHIRACTIPEQPNRIADETDNTYNELMSAQCTSIANKTSNGHDDEETVYDKALFGRKQHAIHVINDEYALFKRV